tara:strand:+ start:154 stop:1710 length:1557 start_codon:yes stop_codon:yes gene_type:complete
MSKEITELRKAGKLVEAYDKSLELLNSTPDDDVSVIYIKRAFAWVLYNQLKRIDFLSAQDEFTVKLKEISSYDFDATEDIFWGCISTILYKTIKNSSSLAKDDIVKYIDSLPIARIVEAGKQIWLIRIIHKLIKGHTSYQRIMCQLGFDCFEEQDFVDYKMDNGKSIMSNVEQVICAYSKALMVGSYNPSLPGAKEYDVDEIVVWIEKVKVLSKGRNMKYPSYYIAKLYITLGDLVAAKEYLMPFAMKNTSQFWVWSSLAEVVKDSDMKASLLAKALLCEGSDQFFNGVKSNLLEYFVGIADWSMVKYLAGSINETCKKNDYKVSARVGGLLIDQRVVNAVSSTSANMVITELSKKCSELLYEDIPNESALVTYVNREKGMASYYINNNETGFFQMSKLPTKLKVEIGVNIDVRIKSKSENGYSTFHTAALSSYIHPSIKKVSGVVNLAKDSRLAFIDKCVMFKDLFEGKVGTYNIEARAIPNFDDKKGRWGHKIYVIDKLKKSTYPGLKRMGEIDHV